MVRIHNMGPAPLGLGTECPGTERLGLDRRVLGCPDLERRDMECLGLVGKVLLGLGTECPVLECPALEHQAPECLNKACRLRDRTGGTSVRR